MKVLKSVRIDEELVKKLSKSAELGDRSFSQELNMRLRKSYERNRAKSKSVD